MLDTKALAETTALVVREAVATAVQPLMARIAALEARELLQGEPGADGRDAVLPDIDAMVARAVSALPVPKDGAPGVDGKDGASIADLLIDRDGNLVCTMTDGRMKALGVIVGRDGTDGINGKDGRDGVDGAPGKDGADGKDGEVGPEGPPGRDGVDGKDGSDGEAGLPGERGADGIDGKDAYPGEARGLFDPDAEYRALDVVSFNGSEWRAKQDNPGPLPGEGWMISAGRGKRGERGEQGPAGNEGRAGASLIAGYVDSKDMQMTLTKDDGTEVKVDLYELADVIRQA